MVGNHRNDLCLTLYPAIVANVVCSLIWLWALVTSIANNMNPDQAALFWRAFEYAADVICRIKSNSSCVLKGLFCMSYNLYIYACWSFYYISELSHIGEIHASEKIKILVLGPAAILLSLKMNFMHLRKLKFWCLDLLQFYQDVAMIVAYFSYHKGIALQFVHLKRKQYMKSKLFIVTNISAWPICAKWNLHSVYCNYISLFL